MTTKTEYPATLELALLACQLELTNPIKDATNPHFKSKYATLPEIRNLVTPILAKHGLYVTQKVFHDGITFLITSIVHAPTKAEISDMMPLMMDKQTPQGQGSALTYARRYALCAMLNIAADEDDDANAASQKPEKKVVKLTPERKEFIIKTLVEVKDKTVFENMQKSAREECESIQDFEAYKMIVAEVTKQRLALKEKENVVSE